MKKTTCLTVLLLVLSLSLATLVSAHGGGLDRNGGHYDRSNGTYHKHR